MASRAIIRSVENVISYPAQPAMNSVAIAYMMAVPSILMVIPRGSTKEAISSCMPRSSMAVCRSSGRVAPEEKVENPKRTTRAILCTKSMEFSPVPNRTRRV